MNNRYSKELSCLSETYSWALEAPIEPLVNAVQASSHLPLVAVGSGGSFSVAHLACSLHQHHSGVVSRPLTPLELVSSPIHLRSLSAMIISAGGSNADIISALENTLIREPQRCIILCLRKDSKLSRLARSYRFVDFPELNLPSGKDGFLSTNSLLAFVVLLVRTYSCAFSSGDSLPRDVDGLLPKNQRDGGYIEDLRASCAPLWERETLVVLYGPSVSTAALDLESKFSEAALGNVQFADFRNFAHGRHHWLAKRESRTAVLAIFAKDETNLAEKTLRLLPSTVPVARICPPSTGATANVAALIAVLYLVGMAGDRRRIDPGRPGVPSFGRKIYGLRALRSLNKVSSEGQTAIARKLGCNVRALRDRRDLPFWQEAFCRFVKGLTETVFSAVLLDYDGTLCDESDRFSGLRKDVALELTRLLQGGILLGIATGRGGSVRRSLREVLPRQFWDSVHIGYYNGSDLGRLSDDGHPNPPGTPTDALKAVAESLFTHPIISCLAECKTSQDQISVRLLSTVDGEQVWHLVQQLAQTHRLASLRSKHSIDVLRPGVSKCSLLNHIHGLLHDGACVLSVGDKGQWPGNDHEILNTPYSLSVDEVSVDPDTCWNLAPAGHRGTQAVLDYFSWIQSGNSNFRLVLPASAGVLS